MPDYNPNAQIYDSQFVIRDSSTSTSSTSGGLIVDGGISASKDTYVLGDIVANEVKITPNLGDIAKEIRVNRASTGNVYLPLDTNFRFYNDTTIAFDATVFANTVDQGSGSVKNAMWQLNGVLVGNEWRYNANFTGELIPGFDLRMTNVAATEGDGAHARLEYTSSTEMVMTYRARTSSKIDPVTSLATSLLSVWAATVGGTTDNDQGFSVAVDSQGNVYLAGRYTSSVSMPIYNVNGTTTVSLRATSSRSAFVVKYDENGQAIWAATVDDVNTGLNVGFSVAVDASRNVYLAGQYGSGEAAIYNGDGTTTKFLRATSGGSAAFVVKFSENGQALSAASVDGSGTDEGRSVAVDGDENVYLAGLYASGVTTVYNEDNTPSGTVSLRATNNSAAFVVKYNSGGVAQWAVSVDGNVIDRSSVAVDTNGKVYLAGTYSGTPVIYNINNITASSVSLPTTQNNSAFVVKYTASGSAVWAASVNGTEDDRGLSVAVDGGGGVYLSGLYTNTATVYNYNNTVTPTVSASVNVSLPDTFLNDDNTSAFVVKYDSTGSAVWSVRVASLQYARAVSVAVDASNNVYFAGAHGKGATVYNSGDTVSNVSLYHDASNTGAAFLVKYDSSGVAVWAASVGASTGRSIAFDSNGNVYLAGVYNGSSVKVYNKDATIALTLPATNPEGDPVPSAAFVVKYNSSGFAS